MIAGARLSFGKCSLCKTLEPRAENLITLIWYETPGQVAAGT